MWKEGDTGWAPWRKKLHHHILVLAHELFKLLTGGNCVNSGSLVPVAVKLILTLGTLLDLVASGSEGKKDSVVASSSSLTCHLPLPGRFLTLSGIIGGWWGGPGRTGNLWLRTEVGEVGDHVVEDRVLVGSAGFTHPRSLLLLLLLLLLLVALLRLVGRIRVAAWLLLLLVVDRVAGVGVLSVRRVGGVRHTLTGVRLLAVTGVAVCLLGPILVILVEPLLVGWVLLVLRVLGGQQYLGRRQKKKTTGNAHCLLNLFVAVT